MDMVHDNPGEPPFVTAFNDPAKLREMGYDAKCFQLFDSALLGLTWDEFDPAIFPAGSEGRRWVLDKAADLTRRYQEVKDAGLQVYCMADLILLPRRLVELHDLGDWRDPRNPATQRILRTAMAEMFERFPQLDGLVVRIGETYLNDAPHHVGGIREKTSPQETIIPLVGLLREELCQKRSKRLFFRTWLSFDTDAAAYEQVSEAVEPHPLLTFSVKHCEGDFHRGNRFSRIMGRGRHPQIVEVQCQREYEGKGAHPNYIAQGVIDGFEEYEHTMPLDAMRSMRQFRDSPLFGGLWTWSRGGGWLGPYLKDESWCHLNAWVLVRWARTPGRSEAEVFADYARQELGLDAQDAAAFRRLCLLSAKAVVRGKRSTHADIRPWFSRDQFIRWPDLPKDPERRTRVLQQKCDAEALWMEISTIARTIQFPDAAAREHVVVSCDYGLHLYRIFRIAFEMADAVENFETRLAAKLLGEYTSTWASWRKLAETHPVCATLYTDQGFRYAPGRGASGDTKRGLCALAAHLDKRVKAASAAMISPVPTPVGSLPAGVCPSP
jgi:hypothetical protein